LRFSSKSERHVLGQNFDDFCFFSLTRIGFNNLILGAMSD